MFSNILWVPVFVDFVLEHRLKLRYGVRIALSLSCWRYSIQGSIRLRFLFAPFALVVTRQIQDWTNSNFSIFFSLRTKLSNWLGEFTTGRNRFQVKKCRNNTSGKFLLFTVVHLAVVCDDGCWGDAQKTVRWIAISTIIIFYS